MVFGDFAGARVINLKDPRHEVLLPTRQNSAISAAISPNGAWVAIGGYGALEIWDTRSNLFVCSFAEPMRQLVTFSPDGKWLVSGTGRDYQVWEVGTWIVRQRLAPHPNSDLLRPMAFSPDSRMLAIALNHDRLQLLETGAWRELATLEAPNPTIQWSLSFSPDGTKLAAGSLPRLNVPLGSTPYPSPASRNESGLGTAALCARRPDSPNDDSASGRGCSNRAS